jgi:choline dehydrogenase
MPNVNAQVNIDSSSLRATGVTYTHDGKVYRVLANRDIILSAGAVNSPQLLMLSGVGPEQQLRQHNVSTLVVPAFDAHSHRSNHWSTRRL